VNVNWDEGALTRSKKPTKSFQRTKRAKPKESDTVCTHISIAESKAKAIRDICNIRMTIAK
jgi:hypothetical protein